MNYTFACPRCGKVLIGEDRELVANDIVQHASVDHDHTVTHEHALEHLVTQP